MKKSLFAVAYWIFIDILFLAIIGVFTTHPINWFIAILIVVLCSVYSIVKSIKDTGYIKQTLAIPENNHKPVYDYIRALAVLFIMFVHVLALDWPYASGMAGTPLYEALNLIRCISGVGGNCLFLMISGALLLRFKDENLLTFYGRRFTKIIVPLVIYYFYYLWEYNAQRYTSFTTAIYKIITADYSKANVHHFWLIYVIISLYVLVPFLRYMLKELPYKKMTALIFVLYIYFVLTKVIINENAMPMNFTFWLMIFLIGYWYSLDESRKYDNIAMVAGGIALILFEVAIHMYPPMSDDLAAHYPYMIVASVGIMASFFKLGDKLKNIYLIRLISQYSYGIILGHMLVLVFAVRKYCYAFTSSLMHKGMGFLFLSLATLMGSVIIAYFIDNITVKPISALFDIKKVNN